MSCPASSAYYTSALAIVLPPAIIPTIYVLTQLGLNGSRLGYTLVIAPAPGSVW